MKRSIQFFILLVAPALLIYTIFMFAPLILSLKYSFYQWNGFGPKTFVGLKNFSKLFTEEPFNTRFANAFVNNVKFFVLTMIIQNGLALILAVLINKGLFLSKFFRTVFFVPTTISVIIVGFLWSLIYNPMWGAINNALTAIGLGNLTRPWLGDPQTALLGITIANAWQFIGIPLMLFTAGIQGIPDDLTEASYIDGCNSRQKFLYITLPLLSPVIFIVTILTFVGNFSAFEIIYAMEGTFAGPQYATDILGTYFYRTTYGTLGASIPDMGLGAAIAACMFALIALAVITWYTWDKKKEA